MFDQNHRELEFIIKSNCKVENQFYAIKGQNYTKITVNNVNSKSILGYETWSPDTLLINNISKRKIYVRTINDFVEMVNDYNSKRPDNQYKPSCVFRFKHPQTDSFETYYLTIDEFLLVNQDSSDEILSQGNTSLVMLGRNNFYKNEKKTLNEKILDGDYVDVNFNLSGFTYNELVMNPILIKNGGTNVFNIKNDHVNSTIFDNLASSEFLHPKAQYNFILDTNFEIDNRDDKYMILATENISTKITQYQDWSKATSSIANYGRKLKDITITEFVGRIQETNSHLSFYDKHTKKKVYLKNLFFKPTAYLEVQDQAILVVIDKFEIVETNTGYILKMTIDKEMMAIENNENELLDYNNIKSTNTDENPDKYNRIYMNIDPENGKDGFNPHAMVRWFLKIGITGIAETYSVREGLHVLGLLKSINQPLKSEPGKVEIPNRKEIINIHNNDPNRHEIMIDPHLLLQGKQYTFEGADTTNSQFREFGLAGHYDPHTKSHKYNIYTNTNNQIPSEVEIRVFAKFNMAINIWNTGTRSSYRIYPTMNPDEEEVFWFQLPAYTDMIIEVCGVRQSMGSYNLSILKKGGAFPSIPYTPYPNQGPEHIQVGQLSQGFTDNILLTNVGWQPSHNGNPSKVYDLVLRQGQLNNLTITFGENSTKNILLSIIPVNSNGFRVNMDNPNVITKKSWPWIRDITLPGTSDPTVPMIYQIEITIIEDKWDLNNLALEEQIDVIMTTEEPTRSVTKKFTSIQRKISNNRKYLSENTDSNNLLPTRKNALRFPISNNVKPIMRTEEIVVEVVDHDIQLIKGTEVYNNVNILDIQKGVFYKLNMNSSSLNNRVFRLVDSLGENIEIQQTGVPGDSISDSYLLFTVSFISSATSITFEEIDTGFNSEPVAGPVTMNVVEETHNLVTLEDAHFNFQLKIENNRINIYQNDGSALETVPLNVYQGYQYIFDISDVSNNGYIFNFESLRRYEPGTNIPLTPFIFRNGSAGNPGSTINVVFEVVRGIIQEGGGEDYSLSAVGINDITGTVIHSMDPYSAADDNVPPDLVGVAIGISIVVLLLSIVAIKFDYFKGKIPWLPKDTPIEDLAQGVADAGDENSIIEMALNTGAEIGGHTTLGPSKGGINSSLTSGRLRRILAQVASKTVGALTRRSGSADLTTSEASQDALVEAINALMGEKGKVFDFNNGTQLEQPVTDIDILDGKNVSIFKDLKALEDFYATQSLPDDWRSSIEIVVPSDDLLIPIEFGESIFSGMEDKVARKDLGDSIFATYEMSKLPAGFKKEGFQTVKDKTITIEISGGTTDGGRAKTDRLEFTGLAGMKLDGQPLDSEPRIEAAIAVKPVAEGNGLLRNPLTNDYILLLDVHAQEIELSAPKLKPQRTVEKVNGVERSTNPGGAEGKEAQIQRKAEITKYGNVTLEYPATATGGSVELSTTSFGAPAAASESEYSNATDANIYNESTTFSAPSAPFPDGNTPEGRADLLEPTEAATRELAKALSERPAPSSGRIDARVRLLMNSLTDRQLRNMFSDASRDKFIDQIMDSIDSKLDAKDTRLINKLTLIDKAKLRSELEAGFENARKEAISKKSLTLEDFVEILDNNLYKTLLESEIPRTDRLLEVMAINKYNFVGENDYSDDALGSKLADFLNDSTFTTGSESRPIRSNNPDNFERTKVTWNSETKTFEPILPEGAELSSYQREDILRVNELYQNLINGDDIPFRSTNSTNSGTDGLLGYWDNTGNEGDDQVRDVNFPEFTQLANELEQDFRNSDGQAFEFITDGMKAVVGEELLSEVIADVYMFTQYDKNEKKLNHDEKLPEEIDFEEQLDEITAEILNSFQFPSDRRIPIIKNPGETPTDDQRTLDSDRQTKLKQLVEEAALEALDPRIFNVDNLTKAVIRGGSSGNKNYRSIASDLYSEIFEQILSKKLAEFSVTPPAEGELISPSDFFTPEGLRAYQLNDAMINSAQDVQIYTAGSATFGLDGPKRLDVYIQARSYTVKLINDAIQMKSTGQEPLEEYKDLVNLIFKEVNEEGSISPLKNKTKEQIDAILKKDLYGELQQRDYTLKTDINPNIKATKSFTKLNETANSVISDEADVVRAKLSGKMRAAIEADGEARRIRDKLVNEGNYNETAADLELDNALLHAVSDGMKQMTSSKMRDIMLEIKNENPDISESELKNELNIRINTQITTDIMSDSNFGLKLSEIRPATGAASRDFTITIDETGQMREELRPDILDVLVDTVKFF